MAHGENPKSFEYEKTYNNYYELWMGKGDPSPNSKELRPLPTRHSASRYSRNRETVIGD